MSEIFVVFTESCALVFVFHPAAEHVVRHVIPHLAERAMALFYT